MKKNNLDKQEAGAGTIPLKETGQNPDGSLSKPREGHAFAVAHDLGHGNCGACPKGGSRISVSKKRRNDQPRQKLPSAYDQHKIEVGK